MHLVMVTSVLRPINDKTVFTLEQRLSQTQKTLISIRRKIPEAHIVVVEGGEIHDDEVEILGKLADYIFTTNITEFCKSPGEGNLLYRFLTSDYYLQLTNVETISKISGRYFLDDNFKWESLPLDKLIFNYIPIGWMDRPLYNTRYYRIPAKYIKDIIAGLETYINSNAAKNAWPDIEHCFYIYVVQHHDEVYSPEKLGVTGMITNSAKIVSD